MPPTRWKTPAFTRSQRAHGSEIAPTLMMHASGAAGVGRRYRVLRIGTRCGQGEDSAGGVVVERDPAKLHLAQDPALVSFAHTQAKDIGGAILDEHTDAFVIADDGA